MQVKLRLVEEDYAVPWLAELEIERGRLEAHVVHAASTVWLVHAGPYRVRVTGTRFTKRGATMTPTRINAPSPSDTQRCNPANATP